MPDCKKEADPFNLIRDTNGCHCRRYGKLIILKFPNRPCFGKKKRCAGLCNFFRASKFCLLPALRACEEKLLAKTASRVSLQPKLSANLTFGLVQGLNPYWLGKKKSYISAKPTDPILFLIFVVNVSGNTALFCLTLTEMRMARWRYNISMRKKMQKVIWYSFWQCYSTLVRWMCTCNCPLNATVSFFFILLCPQQTFGQNYVHVYKIIWKCCCTMSLFFQSSLGSQVGWSKMANFSIFKHEQAVKVRLGLALEDHSTVSLYLIDETGIIQHPWLQSDHLSNFNGKLSFIGAVRVIPDAFTMYRFMLHKTRGPKGHISCTWVQCATFLADWPGWPSFFSIGPKNTNLVEDIEILLPAKFRWIPFSGFRGEVENVSVNQRPGRPSCFSNRPEKHKLGRGRWDLPSCQVSLNSVQRFQRRSRKCLSQS